MVQEKTISQKTTCYHCGEEVLSQKSISVDNLDFCCTGCSTVYELLKENDLCTYYDLNQNAGISLKSKNFEGKYAYLNEISVKSKLLDYQSKDIEKVSLYIPSIHCSSCVWLLENLQKVKLGILNARLNFVQKVLSITYDPSRVSLKDVVELLATLGYEPHISLEQHSPTPKRNRLLQQIAVTGFCMGNIMLLSFPEYFSINGEDLKYQRFFLYLNFLLALPVYLYGAADYLKGSFQNIKALLAKETEILSIDIPIALGISALFVRSTFETLVNQSSGYWDSMTGLVFFLLVGKWVQKKTFDFLRFERTFKSYFPLAVFSKSRNKYINAGEIEEKEIIEIKNEEIIPADGILKEGTGHIDYSFVTGESNLKRVVKEEQIFAGGKHKGGPITIEVTKKLDQGYLTRLWNDATFKKEDGFYRTKLSQYFIKYFTAITICIALIAGTYWYFVNPDLIWPSVTAVLMVACPCALTLSMPFTMSTAMGILGKNKFYVKNQDVLQRLEEIDVTVFDKTGTLSSVSSSKISIRNLGKEPIDNGILLAISACSTHPIARAISSSLQKEQLPTLELNNVKEFPGKGVLASIGSFEVRLGSADFCKLNEKDNKASTYFTFQEQKAAVELEKVYRPGYEEIINYFKNSSEVVLLSGDTDSERKIFENHFGENQLFNQSPEDKLEFVRSKKDLKQNVLMLGDGLNDAGALQKSDVGIVISEEANKFTPACDAILDASVFSELPKYLKFSRKAVEIVKWSFLLSVVYNTLGIGWAVSGTLSPVLAAIFMPLSSLSVVLFAVGSTYLIAKNQKLLSWTL